MSETESDNILISLSDVESMELQKTEQPDDNKGFLTSTFKRILGSQIYVILSISCSFLVPLIGIIPFPYNYGNTKEGYFYIYLSLGIGILGFFVLIKHRTSKTYFASPKYTYFQLISYHLGKKAMLLFQLGKLFQYICTLFIVQAVMSKVYFGNNYTFNNAFVYVTFSLQFLLTFCPLTKQQEIFRIFFVLFGIPMKCEMESVGDLENISDSFYGYLSVILCFINKIFISTGEPSYIFSVTKNMSTNSVNKTNIMIIFASITSLIFVIGIWSVKYWLKDNENDILKYYSLIILNLLVSYYIIIIRKNLYTIIKVSNPSEEITDDFSWIFKTMYNIAIFAVFILGHFGIQGGWKENNMSNTENIGVLIVIWISSFLSLLLGLIYPTLLYYEGSDNSKAVKVTIWTAIGVMVFAFFLGFGYTFILVKFTDIFQQEQIE